VSLAVPEPAVPSSTFIVPRSCSGFRFWVLVLGSAFGFRGTGLTAAGTKNHEQRTSNLEREP